MAKIWVNDSGTWRESNKVWVNDSGTWRNIQKVWTNDGGVWRETFKSVTEALGDVITYTTGTTHVYSIPALVKVLTLDLLGGGGGGAGLTGVTAAPTNYSAATDIIGYPYGIYNYISSHDAAGSSGGNTIVELYNSSNNLVQTYTASGGAGGARSVGSAAYTGGFVGVTTSDSTSPSVSNGESFSNSFFSGSGGTGWRRSLAVYPDCGLQAPNYAVCSFTASQSATGNGAGGGAGGVHNINLPGGTNVKGWSRGGSSGIAPSTITVNVESLVGEGGYLKVTLGSGGSGTGSNVAENNNSVNRAHSRKGNSGSQGATRIKITA